MCKSKIQEGKCPILSKPLTLPITSTASKDSTKQVLRALAIGVGNYRDQSKIIKNIANDVQRLQKTLLRYSKPIYDEIIIETLIDKNATRANITSAFQRIPDEINPGDVFLLYLSGHGVATGGKFCFLPYDFNFSESEALQDSSINSDILVSFMSRIPAHTLLYIIDACYAGTMAKELKQHPMFNYPFIGIEEKTAIDRLAMTSGRVGLYASGENSIALSGETGSLYTKLLIDGLSGKAANSDNYVTVNGLSDYLDSEVPRKSKELFGVEMFSKCDIVNLYNVLRLTYTKE
jgi:uncharacterized caspase-like protein